jgi:hypothetical protein
MVKHNKKMLNELKTRLTGAKKEVGKNKKRTKERIKELLLQKIHPSPFLKPK